MKKGVVKPLGHNTWQFTEKLLGENVYSYLLSGNEKALLIDTAYGFTDIPKAISELTDNPLTVVNTHGHFDHISGNYLYENVYLNEKDRDLYHRHSQRRNIEKILETATDSPLVRRLLLLTLRKPLSQIYSHPFPETCSLPECGYFELGDRKVTIIETPGHTTGSISLLDEKNGWLFSADTCGDVAVLIHFPEGTDLKTYHDTIKRIRKLVSEGKITENYPAHQTSPAPLEKLVSYDQLLTRMEAGSIREDEWKKGIASEGGISIQFDPERVRKEII